MDPRRAPEGVSTDAPTPPRRICRHPMLETEPDASSEIGFADGASGIARGVAAIRAALRTMPATPGVYRMLDRKGDAMYVGKARNLRSRVQNYAHVATLSNRLRRMVAETTAMEIVSTHTEAEALLLECNLIKRLMPRFNVLLRDDKSFPLIHLTADHDVSAADQVSRRAKQRRRLFRAVRLGGRRQPHPDHVAKSISVAFVQQQHLRQSHPSLPAAPDQTVQRALCRTDQPRSATPHLIEEARAFLSRRQ